MPYDPSKTKTLLPIVGGFAGQPGGEFIADLANQLRDAEGEITNAVAARVKAETDANRYAAELATLQTTVRQLREENEALKAAAPKPKKVKAAAPAPATAAQPPPENVVPLPPQAIPLGATPAPTAPSNEPQAGAPKRPRRKGAQ